MTASIITAATASSGLVYSSGNDGTLKLQSGPAGSPVDALTFAADGTPTFLKQPVLPTQSMVRLQTANGVGSTNTRIPRFSTVITNTGSDITYADSATLGSSFTINVTGVYSVSYSTSFSAVEQFGLSLNSSQLSTDFGAITATDRLSIATVAAAGYLSTVSVCMRFISGDVIRPHIAASAVSGSAPTFTITRVA